MCDQVAGYVIRQLVMNEAFQSCLEAVKEDAPYLFPPDQDMFDYDIDRTLRMLGEVTWMKDRCSKNLTRTRNVSPKCNKQVKSKQQTRFSLTSIN
jgi:hypothetical protein